MSSLTWADITYNMEVVTPDGLGLIWGRSEQGEAFVHLRQPIVVGGKRVGVKFYPVTALSRPEANGGKHG